jgi:hypothetical protein
MIRRIRGLAGRPRDMVIIRGKMIPSIGLEFGFGSMDSTHENEDLFEKSSV